ncbi:MAG: ThuA domain-containing protein [Planctomycetes bacterium]|nr:ThuA domain-containing protein [Planctomycetota bacterium]MBL7038457.1 ThuA domain-containing protein [Pirellulaceae bacterium]
MKTRSLYVGLLFCSTLLVGILWSALVQRGYAADAFKAKVLVVAGPCQHPPGTHEAIAGARLLTHCVAHAENVGPISALLLEAWPKDGSVLENTATIVFIGDIFPPERMDERDKIMAQLTKLMDQGCGIVCIHYATGLRGEHVAEDGDHPLLHWMGGYFATGGCKHHRSVARVCPATLVPEDNDHPILQGWKKFAFDDEPYWNNYFGKDGMAPNVTSLVYAMLPPTEPKKETIGWAIQREDGGRGVGLVVPHFFRNWRIDDLRTLVMNSIVWTAKLDVPAEGVKSSLPDLATFKPDSVDPQPRRKR